MSGTVRVPFVDLAAQHRPIRSDILAAIDKVLQHGQFILGEEVAEFERSFADICGTRFAVGVNSGLDALVIALRAAGIDRGDEVIMPPNSFVATAAAAGLLGAVPVFVDTADDFNIDTELIEKAVSKKTKAILPVHLTGRPADMDPVNDIARKHGLTVIEDAAQAVAARYHGKACGALGTIGCFSLHPLKTLNACGDGGVITTDDERLYARMVGLRNHGLQSRDDCREWGLNSRLDTLQASILLAKLPHLAGWTQRRREIAQQYQSALADLDILRVPKDVAGVEAVYHTFIVQTDCRDNLKRHLADHGIDSAIHYPVPIHMQPAAAYLGYRAGDFPTAARQARRSLSIPVHSTLSADQVGYVIDVIRDWAESR